MIDISPRNEIYKEGWRAYFDNISRDACPYEEDEDRYAWEDGWDVASERVYQLLERELRRKVA